MDIKCKLIKELPDGSAIVSLDMDEEAKDFFLGEGFVSVLKQSLEYSKTYVKPEMLKVANDGGDIYFIEPIIQLENSELSKLSFTYGIDPTVIRAILKKASEK